MLYLLMNWSKVYPESSHRRRCRHRLHLLAWWWSMALLVAPAAAFSVGQTLHPPVLVRPTRSSFKLRGVLDDNDQGSDGIDFTNFNPLTYQGSKKQSKNSSFSYSGTRISLRQTNMKELTNKLFESINDKEQTKSILDEYRDFLLEPLEDQDAVLEPDSIYSPSMTRGERYEAYQKSMNERVESSKNDQVRQILATMRDYVLSFEDRISNVD